MKRDELIGTWDLLCCEGESTDDRRYLPYGRRPIGKLIYSSDGHMSVHLMARERDQFTSEEISKAKSAEIKKAFQSFDSYAGTWILDESKNVVVHQVECGRVPNWVGTSQARFCQIEDDILTLSTDEFEMLGAKWTVYVAWERIRN